MTEGKIFATARQRAGLTQTEVATKMGFKSAQFISNIERNKAVLPKSHFGLAAKLLNTHTINKIIDVRTRHYGRELRSELK